MVSQVQRGYLLTAPKPLRPLQGKVNQPFLQLLGHRLGACEQVDSRAASSTAEYCVSHFHLMMIQSHRSKCHMHPVCSLLAGSKPLSDNHWTQSALPAQPVLISSPMHKLALGTVQPLVQCTPGRTAVKMRTYRQCTSWERGCTCVTGL